MKSPKIEVKDFILIRAMKKACNRLDGGSRHRIVKKKKCVLFIKELLCKS